MTRPTFQTLSFSLIYSSLQLVWTDKNSCRQRKGRAGRVKSGRVYRLVFADFYERVLPDEEGKMQSLIRLFSY